MEEGPRILKNAWKYTDATKKNLTRCEFDDADVVRMEIGFTFNNVEVRREEFTDCTNEEAVRRMNYKVEGIERMLFKAFNQGRNHQASVIRSALEPNALPTH